MTGDLSSRLSDDTAPSFAPEELKSLMGNFATGVAAITAISDGQPVGFTCQSFISLSLEPPLIAFAPARTSTTWPKIAAAEEFCVNILASGQEEVCRALAVSGGDKFATLTWRPAPGGAPILSGSLAWIECTHATVYDAGDHELVIGRVIAFEHTDADPLVYFRSRMGTIDNNRPQGDRA